MKHLLYFILASALFSCQSRNDSAQTEAVADPAANATANTAAPAAPNSAFLIAPGERIGQVELNMTAQELNNALGEPDSGDAAMGKALMFWVSEGNGPREYLAVYTVNNFDGSGSPAKVQQAQVTSPDFRTASGIGTGMPLSGVREQFSSIQPMAYYTNKEGRQVYIYDDQAQGIAFEVTAPDSTCTAITIHPKGESVTETYLPIHPDMTPLQ